MANRKRRKHRKRKHPRPTQGVEPRNRRAVPKPHARNSRPQALGRGARLRDRIRRRTPALVTIFTLYLALAAVGWAPIPRGPWSSAQDRPVGKAPHHLVHDGHGSQNRRQLNRVKRLSIRDRRAAISSAAYRPNGADPHTTFQPLRSPNSKRPSAPARTTALLGLRAPRSRSSWRPSSPPADVA